MEEEEKPNTFRKIVGIILVMIVILMTIVYWFIPLNSITFEMRTSESTNFSLSPYGVEGMQFYSNLRYVDENITYNIIPIDWKIPNIKELFTITDHNLFRPATSLPEMKPTGYWSTNPQVCTSDAVWIVNFSYGGVLSYMTRYNCYIRYIKKSTCQ